MSETEGIIEMAERTIRNTIYTGHGAKEALEECVRLAKCWKTLRSMAVTTMQYPLWPANIVQIMDGLSVKKPKAVIWRDELGEGVL